MRKITPLMLVLLMVASLMANIDITQLETNEEIEEAGARNGADAELIAITSPKETQCSPDCRNELLVGQSTSFEVFIQNSGSQDISQLGYKAQVWISDGDGNPITPARDVNGNLLLWDNPDVICDDTSVCNDQTLAAGAVFKGGKTVLQYLGSDIVWTPEAGVYVIQIETYSDEDVDPGNDVQQVYVEVVDYVDIAVDIAWDSGNVVATGNGPHGFTVTVSLGGSTEIITRDLTMLLDIRGDVSAAQDSDGFDLLDATIGELKHPVTIGQQQNVLVFQNETDPTDNRSEPRAIFSSDVNNGVFTYSGSISPDTSGGDAIYSVEVSLGEYSLFGQYQSCIETYEFNVTGEDGEQTTATETYENLCEETFNQDDITSNNIGEINGATNTFHDIRIDTLTIYQGYASNGDGIPSSTLIAGEPGDLSVGTSYVDVYVEHRGSDMTELYDWNVTFTITNLDTNVVTTAMENSCLQGVEPMYEYQKLGAPSQGQMAMEQGHACTMVTFGVGTYSIEANVSLDGKTVDQKMSNNIVSYEIEAVNNLPVIASLDLVTQGDLMIGMEGLLEFEASAFDADDQFGVDLTYSWTGGAGGTPLAGCGGQGDEFQLCQTRVLEEYVTKFPVTVTITDAHGGQVSETITVDIWNNQVAVGETDSGITMTYALTYWSKSAFTIENLADSDEACSGIQLPDPDASLGVLLSGTYDPIAVIDYEPVTTYTSADVLDQSIEFIFDSSLGASSLWYTTSCGNPALTQLIAEGATNSEEDSTKLVLSASNLFGGVMPIGQFMLIDSPLLAKDPPSASISGFSAEASAAGAITMNWGLDGTTLSGDKVSLSITHGDSGDVFEVDLDRTATSYTYSGTNTLHDVSYDIEVAVCNNDGLCSTPIGTGTVVADKQVDDAAATGVGVVEAGDKWTLTWSADGSMDDVASWNVCYKNREAFDAANMPTTCVNTGSADVMTADVMMSTAPGQYTVYFAVVPVDALGNTGTAGSSSDAGADAAFFKANEGGEINNDNTDGDETSSGELPGWTWGAIGGVVVIAFIAGAFILSRGGGDGEDKDWDY